MLRDLNCAILGGLILKLNCKENNDSTQPEKLLVVESPAPLLRSNPKGTRSYFIIVQSEYKYAELIAGFNGSHLDKPSSLKFIYYENDSTRAVLSNGFIE